MKIWFDILTPKQVMFFKRAVKILRQSGHDVLCTSREYREATELAMLQSLDITVVGRHGGADRFEKLKASAARMLELADIVKKFSPEVAVMFASPEGARVAFGLGIRNIEFNDSPHAEAVAKLTVPYASKLLCPWVIPYSAWMGFGIARKDIFRYRALDPAAWLKHEDRTVKTSIGRKTVLVRFEESKASYVADKKLDSSGMTDTAVKELSGFTDVVVLCRYHDQIEQAKAKYGGIAKVVEQVFDGVSLLKEADLFVGAGGTMSAEAALLGVPTISITPLSFHIEDYLIKSGLVVKARDPQALVKLSKKILKDEKYAADQRKMAARMLASMEDPTKEMLAAIMQRRKL